MSREATRLEWRGHQQCCFDAKILTQPTMWALFGMALRQRTDYFYSLLRLIGLDRMVPDFRTLSWRLTTLEATCPTAFRSYHHTC